MLFRFHQAGSPSRAGTGEGQASLPLRRCVLLVLGIVAVVDLVTTLVLSVAPEGLLDWMDLALLNAALLPLLCYPLLWSYLVRPLQRAVDAHSVAAAASQARILEQSAEREFESRLHGALEMADDEPAVIGVARLAARLELSTSDVELLVADNSRAHLRQVFLEPGGGGSIGGCGVEAPRACAAVRRGRPLQFDSSEALDACPMLRGRPGGTCAALCVPVTVSGRAIGVIHLPRPVGTPLPPRAEAACSAIASLAGTRLGMVRVLAKTQLQAETDPLTGLLNRRSLEDRTRELTASGQAYAVVACDLDHFKRLNDTHGHDAGDRALRLFATTLAACVRPIDLVARPGGEEFTLVLPDCSVVEASAVAARVQQTLAEAVGRGTVPRFSASFGVADTTHGSNLDEVLRAADQALYAAKNAGRDCLRVADLSGAPPAP